MKSSTLQLLCASLIALVVVIFTYIFKLPAKKPQAPENTTTLFIGSKSSQNFYSKHPEYLQGHKNRYQNSFRLSQYQGPSSRLDFVKKSNSCGIQQSTFVNQEHLQGYQLPQYDTFTISSEWCTPRFNAGKALIFLSKEEDSWAIEGYYPLAQDSMGELFLESLYLGEINGLQLNSFKSFLLEPHNYGSPSRFNENKIQKELIENNIAVANDTLFLKKGVYLKDLKAALK
ncbi:hypothetical protein [Kangiella sediminilitoris]|uniref:Uncharacterized protein n=1 Tax=Kangiella sediminilitoris TaxID=1144748 RepID=A0A1B3BBQ3_9GAMM|nr:hypothetical protein [Kangiella sediminilitoris]AOE50221.1 hypothetical protein KS2013_1511 [Kangiella sediminilitoris]